MRMPEDPGRGGAHVQAAQLQAAFPGYHVTVIMRWDGPRFELVSKDDANPWCLISPDAREIWRELRAAV